MLTAQSPLVSHRLLPGPLGAYRRRYQTISEGASLPLLQRPLRDRRYSQEDALRVGGVYTR